MQRETQRRRLFRRLMIAVAVGLPLVAFTAVDALRGDGGPVAPGAGALAAASARGDVTAAQAVAALDRSGDTTVAGGGGSGAAADAHADGHGCDDVNPAVIDGTPSHGGPVGCTVGNSGDHRKNGAAADASVEANVNLGLDVRVDVGPAPDGSASDPHANGHGCDDVNPAVIDGTPSHGGPVGCTVGNSGDHRKNGAAADASVGADVNLGLDVRIDVAPAPDGSASDPHANGHGCDDVNPAVIDGTPSHGGPVGCTVGNSGDHRKNGSGGGGGGGAGPVLPEDRLGTGDTQPAAKPKGNKPG